MLWFLYPYAEQTARGEKLREQMVVAATTSVSGSTRLTLLTVASTDLIIQKTGAIFQGKILS